jgi:hypothetical protein
MLVKTEMQDESIQHFYLTLLVVDRFLVEDVMSRICLPCASFVRLGCNFPARLFAGSGF